MDYFHNRWGIKMKRIILMVFRNFIFAVPAWFKLCYYAKHTDEYSEEEKYEFIRYIVERANKGGNVELITIGEENIPKENGFIMFPNHQGFYDVLAIVGSCKKPLSVVFKKEIKDIPFIKQIAACIKAFALDREDIKQSMQVIINVTKEVKRGRNYIIFPEGTRSKNGNNLLEFKGGSFKAATKARCPIVPVAIIDSYKAFDTNSIEPVSVKVIFLPAIPYDVYKDMKTTEIAQEVRNRIEATIKNYENSLK